VTQGVTDVDFDKLDSGKYPAPSELAAERLGKLFRLSGRRMFQIEKQRSDDAAPRGITRRRIEFVLRLHNLHPSEAREIANEMFGSAADSPGDKG